VRIIIRTNGRGNAWPLELGAHGARHDAFINIASEYANTSLSILGYQGGPEPSWEVLFDIGQGVLPFLVQHGNRLPTAILLSHSHYDHVSGLDWLGASAHRNGQPIPVFTTTGCWQDITQRFPWLTPNFIFHSLPFGVITPITGINGLRVTAFPVYHGMYAPGACLLLVEYIGHDNRATKAILSGDLLCPLIDPNHYHLLEGARIAYVDANTRFPHPDTGHWSIIEAGLAGAGQLAPWIAGRTLQDLLVPHGAAPLLPAGIDLRHDLCWSIETFVDRLHPQSVALVHYSGYEDQQILTDAELRNWLPAYLNAAAWQVPRPAHEFILYDGP
jgi:hypothetical protein